MSTVVLMLQRCHHFFLAYVQASMPIFLCLDSPIWDLVRFISNPLSAICLIKFNILKYLNGNHNETHNAKQTEKRLTNHL